MSEIQRESRAVPSVSTEGGTPQDPLAGDWSEGLRGPLRAHGIPTPARIHLLAPSLPIRPAAPERAEERPAAQDGVDAPAAWALAEEPAAPSPTKIEAPQEPVQYADVAVESAAQAEIISEEPAQPETIAEEPVQLDEDELHAAEGAHEPTAIPTATTTTTPTATTTGTANPTATTATATTTATPTAAPTAEIEPAAAAETAWSDAAASSPEPGWVPAAAAATDAASSGDNWTPVPASDPEWAMRAPDGWGAPVPADAPWAPRPDEPDWAPPVDSPGEPQEWAPASQSAPADGWDAASSEPAEVSDWAPAEPSSAAYESQSVEQRSAVPHSAPEAGPSWAAASDGPAHSTWSAEGESAAGDDLTPEPPPPAWMTSGPQKAVFAPLPQGASLSDPDPYAPADAAVPLSAEAELPRDGGDADRERDCEPERDHDRERDPGYDRDPGLEPAAVQSADGGTAPAWAVAEPGAGPVPVSLDDPNLLVPVEDGDAPEPAREAAHASIGHAAVPPAGLVVAGEHRVAVHTRGGGTRRGTVTDVDLGASQFPLQPQGGGSTETVLHSDVKAIFFMLAPGERAAPGLGTRVRVTLADGRTIEGHRDGEDGPQGFFLIPLDAQRTNTRKIYVASEAVRELQAI